MAFKGAEGMFNLVKLLVLFQYFSRGKVAGVGTYSQKAVILFSCGYLGQIKLVAILPVSFRKYRCGFFFSRDGLASNAAAV